MKNLTLLIALLFCRTGFAQFAYPSAAGAGMGQATIARQDVNSLLSNQSGLAWVENLSVVAAAEQRFFLSELNGVTAGIAVPAGTGTFGLVVHAFGYEAFRQQKIGLAYARKIFDNFGIGAQFDYFQTRIDEYGSRGALTFEAGMQAKFSDFVAGMHIFSPAQIQLAASENFPVVFRTGIAWSGSENTLIALEIEKDIAYQARIRCGLEYRIAEMFFLRVGAVTNPAAVHFGVGYRLNSRLRLDAATAYHQQLGFSPVAGASWSKDRAE